MLWERNLDPVAATAGEAEACLVEVAGWADGGTREGAAEMSDLLPSLPTAAAYAPATNCPASLDLPQAADPANSGGGNDGGVGRARWGSKGDAPATRVPAEAAVTGAAGLAVAQRRAGAPWGIHCGG